MTENKENINQTAADSIHAVKSDSLEEVKNMLKELAVSQKSLKEEFSSRFGKIDKKVDKLAKNFKETKETIKSLNRKIKDIESDQRTTQAIGRAVLDSGISFKDTRIPYPLQGNAAIEDIKDYY